MDEVDTNNATIFIKESDNSIVELITLTEYENCMPYLQYNGVRYVGIDRYLYILYRDTQS